MEYDDARHKGQRSPGRSWCRAVASLVYKRRGTSIWQVDTGVGANKCLHFCRGVRGSGPPEFLYIFNTKSCILVHSLATKMGTTSVFYQRPLCIGGNGNCWKRLLNEARRAENRGRRPRAGWGSWGGEASPTS